MMMRGGGEGGGGGGEGEGGRGEGVVNRSIQAYIRRENQTISLSVLEYISRVVIYATKLIDCIYSIIVFIYVLEERSK